ncbi:MAG TPA: hypothetical protein ENJ18_18700 [Nannocystis exedens]|nr:hypothetical protein [Nannocystis exedens]
MAPEQHRGHEVDARTDQFGLCAALYEALYGVRPFAGTDVKSIRKQAIRGEIRPPPVNSGVPRWVERALLRGLAPAPEDRWPSLDSLLDALSRDPSKRWGWIGAVILGLALLAGASYALASHRAKLANRCTGASAQLVEIWGEKPRNDLRIAFQATNDPLATATLPRIERRLDAYSQDWIHRHTKSCEAHGRGETSAMLLDRTMACLRQRKGDLSALVQVLMEATPGTIENAVVATHNLPNLAACADSEALLAALPLPDEATAQGEVEALRGDLGRVLALEGAGRYDEGLEFVTSLKTRVKNVNYPPLTAEFLLREGSLRIWGADFATAALILQEAFATGIEARLERVAVEAIAKWIFAVGYGLGRIAEIESPQVIGLSMAKRIEHSDELQALFLSNYASAKSGSNSLEETVRLYRGALRLLHNSSGEEDPQVAFDLFNIANSYLDFSLCTEAGENLQMAIRAASQSLSKDHPMARYMAMRRCAVLACRGNRAEATNCYREEAQLILEDSSVEASFFGEHFLYAASLLLDSGDLETARAELIRLDSIFDTDDSILRVWLHRYFGWIDLTEGNLGSAADHFAESAALSERLELPRSMRIDTQAGLAEIELARGQLGPAQKQLATDLAVIDSESPRRPWIFAQARFTLARTLAASANQADRDRARQSAARALQSLESDHTQDGLRAQIATWLNEFDRAPAPAPAPDD